MFKLGRLLGRKMAALGGVREGLRDRASRRGVRRRGRGSGGSERGRLRVVVASGGMGEEVK